MQRLILLFFAALSLAACTGGPSDANIPNPPGTVQEIENTGIAQADQVINGWRESARSALIAGAVKPETIVERVTRTDATLQEINDFYRAQLTQNGWIPATRMPGVQGNILLSGYEAGTTYDAVIGAIDLKEFGQTGVVVYTLRGNR